MYKKYKLSLIFLFICLSYGCSDLLEPDPLSALSAGTFWRSENDAHLALMGVYAHGSESTRGSLGFRVADTYMSLDAMTDNGNEKDDILTHFNNGEMESTNPVILDLWRTAYRNIGRANNFIMNIDLADIDQDVINEMKSEARFIRAYFYFNMLTYWGDVPLVTDVITIEEANNVSRDPKEQIVEFVLQELTEAAEYLPESRPDSEFGRVTRAGALAIKARLLMAEQKWTEASEVYNRIINMGLYQIDDNYASLFLEEGLGSSEIILPIKYTRDNYATYHQRSVLPFQFGGWQQYSPYNELVEDYLMIDGLSIEQSPLYDPDNPYENRDPRLYDSIFLPEYTSWKGQLYIIHPDSSNASWRLLERDWSGYSLKKFADEEFEGAVINYGADFPMIRYAEILLSYLESKLESGDVIDQALLDQTINQIRGRASVSLPPVTETNTRALREILRQERRIELAFEGFRLFDLHRWGISHEVFNGWFHGMKLTSDPSSYTSIPVNENGYFRYVEKGFREGIDYRWPIPQREIDINPNLGQNPGF